MKPWRKPSTSLRSAQSTSMAMLWCSSLNIVPSMIITEKFRSPKVRFCNCSAIAGCYLVHFVGVGELLQNLLVTAHGEGRA